MCRRVALRSSLRITLVLFAAAAYSLANMKVPDDIKRDDYLTWSDRLERAVYLLSIQVGPADQNDRAAGTCRQTLLLPFAFLRKTSGGKLASSSIPKSLEKIDQHVIGVIYYINDDDGITYEVQAGRVDSVEYGPAKKYDHLYCGDPK